KAFVDIREDGTIIARVRNDGGRRLLSDRGYIHVDSVELTGTQLSHLQGRLELVPYSGDPATEPRSTSTWKVDPRRGQAMDRQELLRLLISWGAAEIVLQPKLRDHRGLW